MKVAVISRNLIYRMGGAEVSLREELARRNNEASVYSLVYLHQPNSNIEIDYSGLNIQRFPVKSVRAWRHSFDIEYFMHRKKVEEHLEGLDASEIITQGKWAPLAIEFATAKGLSSTYYVRDESSLNIRKNYKGGIRRMARSVQQAVESPFAADYIRRNVTALKQASKVISNSHFMAGLLLERYGVESTVIYPFVDEERLRDEYRRLAASSTRDSSGRKNIVLVGGSEVKGIKQFVMLAQRLSQYNFVVYSQCQTEIRQCGNMIYRPWCNSSAAAFVDADLVLMPSQWDEAFGRVAVEARALCIPCIVSNRGGLPEAVNHDSRYIANDIDDFARKIKDILH